MRIHLPGCALSFLMSHPRILLDSIKASFDFKGFILLDPTVSQENTDKEKMIRVLLHFIWSKHDTWPSREAARQEFSKQPGTRNWHPEVLDLFLVTRVSVEVLDFVSLSEQENALRDHWASKLPQPYCFKGGVSLACTRTFEAVRTGQYQHLGRAHCVALSLSGLSLR